MDIHKWQITPSQSSVSSPQSPVSDSLLVPQPITLNLWDFGGQGVYQVTHQFFFTSRSLYFIVVNARASEQESRLNHWLKLAASLSNNAPVIIVVNKQDEHPLQLDEWALKHKCPNLLHVIPSTFPNLPLTEQIPIAGAPGKTIAYHALCNLEKRGIEKHYDPVYDVELDVKALLAGIETPALRHERQMQERLMQAYDLDELQQLCFNLAVEYENLPGQTKSAKTRELAQYMGRHGRLDELELAMRR